MKKNGGVKSVLLDCPFLITPFRFP